MTPKLICNRKTNFMYAYIHVDTYYNNNTTTTTTTKANSSIIVSMISFYVQYGTDSYWDFTKSTNSLK
jgi:hypothetical protein